MDNDKKPVETDLQSDKQDDNAKKQTANNSDLADKSKNNPEQNTEVANEPYLGDIHGDD